MMKRKSIEPCKGTLTHDQSIVGWIDKESYYLALAFQPNQSWGRAMCGALQTLTSHLLGLILQAVGGDTGILGKVSPPESHLPLVYFASQGIAVSLVVSSKIPPLRSRWLGLSSSYTTES